MKSYLVFKMYSGENKDKFPPQYCQWNKAPADVSGPATSKGLWTDFDGLVTYPDYTNDPYLTLCPSDGEAHAGKTSVDAFMGTVDTGWNTVGGFPASGKGGSKFYRTANNSYVYMGHIIDPQWVSTSAGAFDCTIATAQTKNDSPPGKADYDDAYAKDFTWPVTGFGTVTFYAFKEGIERFFITDINNPAGSAKAQSQAAMYWDSAIASVLNGGTAGNVDVNEFNHIPGGSNILYMDGHVEFAKFPTPVGDKAWPLTKIAVTEGYF